MDKDHGFLDHFLITVPNAQKQTLEQEEGTHYLADLPLQDFVTLFAAIYTAHKNVTRSYTLDPATAQLIRALKPIMRTWSILRSKTEKYHQNLKELILSQELLWNWVL